MKLTLTRTGTTPIRFEGELLAEHTTTTDNPKNKRDRRFHLATYRTNDARYVAYVHFQTTWETEVDHHWAEVFRSPADLAECLSTREPIPLGVGYPADKAFVEKHNHLMDVLNAQYQSSVSAVLVPEVFAVEADDKYTLLRKAAMHARNAIHNLLSAKDEDDYGLQGFNDLERAVDDLTEALGDDE